MGGAEKPLELSSTQLAALKAMGIPVWHARTYKPASAATTNARSHSLKPPPPAPLSKPKARAPEVEIPQPSKGGNDESQTPAVDKQSTPKVDPIEFAWVCGRWGMMLLPARADSPLRNLAKDIVVYGDWYFQHQSKQAADIAAAISSGALQMDAKAKVTHGDFRWPQLLDSGGTPERAIQAFFKKHLAHGSSHGGWLAITDAVAADVSPWVDEHLLSRIEVPDLAGKIGDAAMKKRIWSTLQQLA